MKNDLSLILKPLSSNFIVCPGIKQYYSMYEHEIMKDDVGWILK